MRGIDQGAGSTTAATGQSRIGLLHAATRKVRSATRGRGPAYRCWARRENPARVQAAGVVHVTRIAGRHRRQSPFREKAEHFHAGQRVWECSAFRRRPVAGFGGSISGRWRHSGNRWIKLPRLGSLVITVDRGCTGPVVLRVLRVLHR